MIRRGHRVVVARIVSLVVAYDRVKIVELEAMGDKDDAYGQPRWLFSSQQCVRALKW